MSDHSPDPTRIHHVDCAGLDVAFLGDGNADDDRPLAVLLHGYPDSAWTWRHLLPELRDAGFRVAAPFLRGYAPTAIPSDGRYQAGVLGVDANLLHDALHGDERAVLIGHDWGAMATYSAAGLEPQRWRRVVAAAVPPGPVTATGFMSYDQLRLSWYMFFQLEPLSEMVVPMDDFEFVRRLWKDWSPGYDPTEDLRQFSDAMATPANVTAALSFYRHTLRPELQDPALADAQAKVFEVPPQPMLYLHGDTDGCMSAALGAQAGDHLGVPGSRAVMVSDAGHFLHLEQPEVVNTEVVEFVTSS